MAFGATVITWESMERELLMEFSAPVITGFMGRAVHMEFMARLLMECMALEVLMEFTDIPTAITASPGNVGTSGVNLSTILSPTYIAAIPKDPSIGTDADTQYVIFRENGRVVASAASELNPGVYISVVR